MSKIWRSESSEEMYYGILDDARKEKKNYHGIEYTFHGLEAAYIVQSPFTRVVAITTSGLPIITEYKHSQNPMFRNKWRILGKKLVDNFSQKIEYVEEIETYLKKTENLAFIMPNGHFIFKKDEETLEDVAERILISNAKFSKKLEELKTLGSKVDFMINEVGAIAFIEKDAVVNVSTKFKARSRIKIWIYVILNTEFIKVRGLIAI